jgi:uncharacterized OB-fold protein
MEDGHFAPESRPVAPAFLGRSPAGNWELLGRRCGECAETGFGRENDACQRCGSADLSDVSLGDRGALWTFTVLRNPPPGSRRTTRPDVLPQPLGLVELQGAVRVMTRIDVPVERLSIGMPLKLVTEELFDDNGTRVVGYSFTEQANV